MVNFRELHVKWAHTFRKYVVNFTNLFLTYNCFHAKLNIDSAQIVILY